MSKTRIFALGGLDENGKNLYCIEIGEKILVVNCGIKIPDDNQYGVEVIIPDFKYLIENKDRISGVIITHYHDDMMDAVPYLLKQINVPVYAPILCCFRLKAMFEKAGIKDYNLTQINRNGITEIDGIKVRTFGLHHSTPAATGIAIDTPDGAIVIAEQFLIDLDAQELHFKCDIGDIADIGKNGVFVAMIESSTAATEGFTSPRHRITNAIKPVLTDAQGRIIISCYKQAFFRIREIISLAAELKKSVFIYDDELNEFIKLLEDLNLYHLPKGMLVTKNKFSNEIDDIVILVTENGKNVFNKMNRIATNEDEIIELREDDTIIIASPVSSGSINEASVMEDELYKDNVNIVKLDSKTVLAAHPAKEDVKMMLAMLNPKYFIPVMGDYRQFIDGANLAMESGFTPDRIIILDNGQVATFENGILKNCSDFVETGEINIASADKKDITAQILKDRELLSTDGIIIVGIAISYQTKEVIGGPDIQSRGVIYVKDSEYVLKNVGKMVTDIISDMVEAGTYDNMAARAEIREKISYYVFRETGKRPMILPAIIEINV
ncbi:MAG: ribonuclease J [Erysipelotrichaceae bacterium]|nr:ribonuclease J [Erysipelotrichaceae bacterium]